LWESAFGYAGKIYHYLVNGETGKVGGKRPYSAVKIALAVIAGIIIFIILMIVSGDGDGDGKYGYEYEYSARAQSVLICECELREA
jgi:hypothetical protein